MKARLKHFELLRFVFELLAYQGKNLVCVEVGDFNIFEVLKCVVCGGIPAPARTEEAQDQYVAS